MLGASGLPDLQFTVQFSELLYDLTGQRRIWNRAEKEALEEELEKHHERRIPEHFRQDARGKHGYQPRSPIYLRIKDAMYHSRTDLVKRGRTEQLMTRMRRIAITGTAAGRKGTEATGLVGTLYLKFPFPVADQPSDPRRVTVEKMAEEIKHTTDAERSEIAMGFGRRVARKIGDPQYRRTGRTVYRS